MKKIFEAKASWYNDASVILEVDFDKLTPELATEINNFWGNSKYRLMDCGNDPVRAVIRLFASRFMAFAQREGGIDARDDDKFWLKRFLEDQYEGWPKADELGIHVVVCNVESIGWDDVDVEEVQ